MEGKSPHNFQHRKRAILNYLRTFCSPPVGDDEPGSVLTECSESNWAGGRECQLPPLPPILSYQAKRQVRSWLGSTGMLKDRNLNTGLPIPHAPTPPHPLASPLHHTLTPHSHITEVTRHITWQWFWSEDKETRIWSPAKHGMTNKPLWIKALMGRDYGKTDDQGKQRWKFYSEAQWHIHICNPSIQKAKTEGLWVQSQLDISIRENSNTNWTMAFCNNRSS